MATIQFQEQLSGNLAFAASAFELAHTPINNSLMIFVTGSYQSHHIDYEYSSTDILFTYLVASGIDVRASYSYATADLGCPANERLVRLQETLPENQTSPASAFILSQIPAENNLFVFEGGNLQRNTIDYNVNGRTLTFNSLVASGIPVDADYRYSVETDSVLPAGVRGSTTLNHVITSYELLAERIKMQLGWPIVQIEMCDDQIYDFINQAVEWYSKYAGQTEEYLIFDSCMYECGVGVKMDRLFTAYPRIMTDGAGRSSDPIGHSSTTGCCNSISSKISGQFIDCDLNDYRKVASVFSVDPVSRTGTDTLFTMDYLFAQQTYFSYMLGSFGFDLITWHVLKDWLDLRKKLFATEPYIRFDPRSQYMKITPEARGQNGFYGVVGCRVERSIADLVQERWVQRYALALAMISLGHIRGKFGSVTLFGGGTINATDIMTQGLETKKELENELMNSYGEAEPPIFFIG